MHMYVYVYNTVQTSISSLKTVCPISDYKVHLSDVQILYTNVCMYFKIYIHYIYNFVPVIRTPA